MPKRIDKNVIDIHTGRPLYESTEVAAPEKPAKALKAAKGAKGAKKNTFARRGCPSRPQMGLGGALHTAIKQLAQIIAGTSVDEPTREEWLERLWRACEEDEMPISKRLVTTGETSARAQQ